MLRCLTALVSLAAIASAQTAPCFERQYGSLLNMTDDSVSLQTLPFSFPFNGTSTSVVTICSNGFLWLDGTSTNTDYTPTEAEFIGQPARIAPLWVDVNPALAVAGAGVWVNSFAPTPTTPGRFVVTWDRCPYYGTTNSLTMQVQIEDTGSVTFFYEASSFAHTSAAIAGVTPGVGAASHIVDFTTVPLDSGTSPNIYELFNLGGAGPLDLVGQGLLFIDNGSNGFLTIPNACPTGAFVKYGRGCPKDATVYESFSTGTCDLANTSMRWINTANGYLATVGGGWDPNFSNVILGVGDDTIHQGLPIGFSFPYAGTLHTTVDLCSNGFLWMGSNASADYSATINEFLTLTPRIAPLWRDLAANLAGTVYWDTTPNYAMATWSGVQTYGVAGSINDVQVKLYVNGDIEFNYGTVHPSGGTAVGGTQTITGFTEGNNAFDPGTVDFTAVVPGYTIGRAGRVPLVLDAQVGTSPQIGTAFTMELSNLPAGTAISVFAIGLFQQNIDASIYGLAGCSQYVSLDATVLALTNGASTTTFTLNIPSDSSFIGVQLFAQGLSFSPGYTQVGVIASNGGRIQMGL